MDNKDLIALNKLIDDATAKETALAEQEQALALQNEQFAKVLEQHKRQEAELNVLWDMVRSYMEENGIKEHTTNSLSLKLVPLGKYKTDCIEQVDDSVCDVKKVLNNKKIKAYFELHNALPDGVESYGNRLVKKVL